MPRDLPPEILDRIFELKEGFGDTIPPMIELLSFLRVCRSWYPVAARRLYSTIELREWKARQVAQGLLVTLTKNRHLAEMVRNLTLELKKDDDDEDEKAKASDYIQIIDPCTNLACITLLNYGAYDRSALKQVLAAASLISLHIKCEDSARNLFRTDELLRMMAHWPRVESVSVSKNVMAPSKDVRRAPVSCDKSRQGFSDSGRNLRKLRLLEGAQLSADDMRDVLSLPFSHVEEFSARLEDNAEIRIPFVACLRMWSSRITGLMLDMRLVSSLGRIDDVFSMLHCLEKLAVHSTLVSPRAILALPALVWINYYISKPEDVDELVAAFTMASLDRKNGRIKHSVPGPTLKKFNTGDWSKGPFRDPFSISGLGREANSRLTDVCSVLGTQLVAY
ncbi:hypothetical protein DFH11DRAFT_1605148 [Phellopilus nigrolimitatus]|nr:hypothetical protein DFH11DRAFT_1605148 [Phellopilus nigrolimitatus]